MKAICESDIDRTHRTHISEYYRGAVFGLLEDNSDIPYLEKIFRIDNSRPACYQKCEIIEQLGRMLVQDGYSEDSVIEAATIAAKLYRMGYTVKEIKAYGLLCGVGLPVALCRLYHGGDFFLFCAGQLTLHGIFYRAGHGFSFCH